MEQRTNMFIILFIGEPPFLPESFDRILLDAPCSGMGQRPNMACTWTLKEVTSYQPLQRKLFTVVGGDTLLREKGDFYYFDILKTEQTVFIAALVTLTKMWKKPMEE